MKIGLISRARTQSTAIIHTLSKKYNLYNNFEEYLEARNNILTYQSLKSLCDKNYNLNNDFQRQVKNITNKIFLKENFVCKLWPSMLIAPVHKFSNNETFEDVKNKIIFNISEYFRILDYDQLYYLDRNLHRSTISWVYANKVRLFHRYKLGEYLPPVITIDENDFNIIRFYILEYCLQEKIKDFLCKNNISFIDITKTYTQYIDNNVINMVATDNDYTKLISNYDILPVFIDNWYNTCCENTIDWKYY